MVRQDEEDRAVLFRQQQERRAQAEAARNQSLRGTGEGVQDIRDGWEPVLLARLESSAWTDPDGEDDE